jgi:hypothetical protein
MINVSHPYNEKEGVDAYESELEDFLDTREFRDNSTPEYSEDEFYDEQEKNILPSEDDDSADSYVYDIDFSQFNGKDFKSSLKKVHHTARKAKRTHAPIKTKANKTKPLNKFVSVQHQATMSGKGGANTTKKVLVPSNQEVIIQGVDNFILSKADMADSVKKIGYYKGKKLKELIIIINNDGGVDFNLELFNPSMPLDYLYSTSSNLNNKITVAGGEVSYSDILFNLLGNPTHIANAKFSFGGPQYSLQKTQPLIFKNKSMDGEQKIDPLQLSLQVDTMQVANDIVFFDIRNNLKRMFIPNGMDVIQYKVLAGNTCTFAFYYEQKDLRKFFFEEARQKSILI